MTHQIIENIYIRRSPLGSKHQGMLHYNGNNIPCCLGKNGISINKKEGDQATPAGSFQLLFGFYRSDRIKTQQSLLPLDQIKKHSGWCDDQKNPNYNRLVELPFKPSHEILTREDRLYDICLVMDHNYSRRIKNRGSAVFFHLTNNDNGPTQGCVAIDPKWMMLLLPRLNMRTTINIIA